MTKTFEHSTQLTKHDKMLLIFRFLIRNLFRINGIHIATSNKQLHQDWWKHFEDKKVQMSTTNVFRFKVIRFTFAFLDCTDAELAHIMHKASTVFILQIFLSGPRKCYLSQSCTSCTLSSSRRLAIGLRSGRGC